MKGLVLCNKGIEEIIALDIKEIIRRKAKSIEGYVVFELEKKEELCKLCYLSQAAKKIVLVLDSFKFQSEKEIIEKAKKLNLEE